jgi:hypothetical protein
LRPDSAIAQIRYYPPIESPTMCATAAGDLVGHSGNEGVVLVLRSDANPHAAAPLAAGTP